MQVAVQDQQDTHRPYFPNEEHVEKSTVRKPQTIESLLPDEEDLFSGVLDELECTGDDEDFDLFSSSGGLELEENSKFKIHQQNSVIPKRLNSNQTSPDYISSYEHPSRTHFVKNVDNRVVVVESDCLVSSGISVNNCMKDGHIYSVHSPMASIYDQFVHVPHYSTHRSNCNPSFHPQSVPTNHEPFVYPYGPQMEHIFTGISYNSFQNHHLNPVMWSHSPHSFPNLHALSETPPPVFSFSPIHNQHVIESPKSCNTELQIAYMKESCKQDVILNPLRVVGFQSKVASPVKSHKSLEKRDTGSTLPLSFSRSRGRVRRISHGKHDTFSCHTDGKKYELDIERVLSGEDNRTTLMIKNIPNKYTSTMLLAAINEHNQGTYDFIYLPLDFKNKCNMGYAFINMIDPLQIVQFHKSFNGKKWEKFHSGKVAYLAYGRIQGKAALIAHFQESSLMNEDKCCHPILFTTNGPNAGNQEPFPLGPNVHSRRHKNKCNMLQVNENTKESCQLRVKLRSPSEREQCLETNP